MREDLFGNPIFDSWEDHWVDMPEFIQPKNHEYQKIIVRFESEEDVVQFAKLIGQTVTPKTQSIWFPSLEKRDYSIGYVDEK